MSRAAKLALAAGGVAAAVGGAKLRGFYRELDFDTGHDEVLTAETSDGWRLTIYRYAAKGDPKPFPVLACHGFAGSRLIWDLTPGTSLARYLADAGYDFYAVDLRGRATSWPSGGPSADLQWSFDDFVERDLPAAVSAACQRSGTDQAFWLGLEMSGQALYAAAISGTAGQIRGGITLGSPVLTPATAMVPGVTTQPQMRRNGRVQFRAGAHFAGPILALLRSKQLESSFVPENFDPLGPARYLWGGIPDESTVLADQFGDWIDNGVMRSLDRATVWSDRLDEVRLPVLVMAAAHDLQRPPEATHATFEALGSTDKTWIEAGVSSGFSLDYGHDDLVAGRASRAEVFPRIRAWLDRHGADGTATRSDRHDG